GQRHKCAADNQHLLLTTRECPRRLGHPFAEAREECEHSLEAVGALGLRSAWVGAQLEVLAHREAREHLAALRHLHNTALAHPVARQSVDALAVEAYLGAARV